MKNLIIYGVIVYLIYTWYLKPKAAKAAPVITDKLITGAKYSRSIRAVQFARNGGIMAGAGQPNPGGFDHNGGGIPPLGAITTGATSTQLGNS